MVDKIEAIINKMRNSPHNIEFSQLCLVCDSRFEQSSRKGSHIVYKTPWIGDPRINIQNRNGKAKPYQVRQVLAAIDRLDELNQS